MEREIRFRVWNGNEMEYSIVAGRYGVFYVNPENGTGLDPRDTASLTPNNTKYFDSTPLMQYTGLKDKNGKEIYEGDIIKKEEYQPPLEFCGYTLFTIEFNQFAFRFVPITKINNGWILGNFDSDIIEVVGNIYENPELLI